MKTNELSGAALDWAVAKTLEEYKPIPVPSYSTDWAQGGPIIEREEISIDTVDNGWRGSSGGFFYEGQTPLIAAMRCYVASKLGDEINVPEELK